jgi:hypothetical protein
VPVGAAIVKAGDQQAWDEFRMHLGQKYPEALTGYPANVQKGGEFLQAYIDARRSLKGVSSAFPYQATEMGGYLQRFNRATGQMELVRDAQGNPMPANVITATGMRGETARDVAEISAQSRKDVAAANQAAAAERQVAKGQTEAGMKGVSPNVVVAPGQQPTATAETGAPNVLEAKRRVALETSLPKARAALSASEAKLNDMEANLDALIKDPTLKNITGSEIAKYKGDWPTIFGTKSADAQARIQQVLAQGGFNELMDLKASSPTGGALGSVSDTEGQYLRAAFARLAQTQDYPTFIRSLNELKTQIARSRARIRSTFDEEFAPINNAGAAPAGGAAAPAGGAAPLADPLGIR